jgi:hypothetical protein
MIAAVSAYMNIPGVVEAEPLHSVQTQSDGKTFDITISVGDTANDVFQANAQGRHYELVVLALDGGFFALDEVYVAGVSLSAGDPAYVSATLEAREVRFV